MFEALNLPEGPITSKACEVAAMLGVSMTRRPLGAYLQQERPKSADRSIFLTSLPPYRPLAWSTTITQISKHILREAGVDGPHLGAHRFRHTVATHMVQCGSSFKEVADVLGHKSLGSTSIYAKLDQRSLEQIALPWPGGAR